MRQNRFWLAVGGFLRLALVSWRTVCLVCVFFAVEAIGSPAQTFKTLVEFGKSTANGAIPVGLVQATNGNFYGVTAGTGSYGTVFKITQAGKLTTLHTFRGQDTPSAGLVQATDGNFYGTTFYGGANSCGGLRCGRVFKITAGGALTTLHNFDGTDGAHPISEMVQATDGDFYGVTAYGGVNDSGTIFKITAGGTLTTLHIFDGRDGDYPIGLMQATDGNFYGTTAGLISGGHGTVFKITRGGVLTTLHHFCSQANCTDGSTPEAGLAQAADGNFYGTTTYGGANSSACYGGSSCGTVFKITSAGTLTTLYSFCSQTNCIDGANPEAGLAQATDGNFYGTTYQGGANSGCYYGSGCGTVFEITPAGALTTLHNFDGGDGGQPGGGGALLQGTDGTFYGTTLYGGISRADCLGGCGTVFSLSLGFGPFVSFVQDSGKVGWNAEILGQGFTGTTGISFNGTPAAAFVVKSDTYLRATVPAGATTGALTVTTPGGTLTSNVPFRVRPQILSFSPTSGPVGTPVTITGVSLTQTTKVNFGGIHASFTVNSDTQVTATVPSGAQSGHIAIVTAGGKTWSVGDFTVTP